VSVRERGARVRKGNAIDQMVCCNVRMELTH
jgi:hypothetical protein